MVCAVRLTVNVDCWGPSSDCSAAPRGQVLKQDIKDEELFHKLSPQTAGLFSCSQGFHTVKYYNNIDTVPELQMYWVKLGNWKEVSEYSNDDFFKIWMYSKFVKRLRTKKKENVKILLYSFIITIINWTLTLGLSLMELLLDLSHSLFRFSPKLLIYLPFHSSDISFHCCCFSPSSPFVLICCFHICSLLLNL